MPFKAKNTNLSLRSKVTLARLIKRDKFCYWMPNQPQADLIKAVGTKVLAEDKRIFLVTSGNGTGKTTAVINIIATIVYGIMNKFKNIRDDEGRHYTGFFDYELFHNWPKDWPKNIWYVSNKDSLDAIWEEFEKWFPASWINPRKAGKNHISIVDFLGTEWTLFFKTVDQDPKTFESANVSLVIFDEPPPRALYKAAVSRLRAGGFMIIPATPLFGASYFVDEIINRIDEDGDKVHQTVSMWDNCKEKCGMWDLGPKMGRHYKGVLKQKDIEFQIRNFDPDEREARVWGRFMFLSGLIYKTYHSVENSEGICHRVEIPKPLQPWQYVYQFVVDPHDRRPPAACWIRIDQYGRKRVIREWPGIQDEHYAGRMYHEIKAADPFIVDDFVKAWCEIERELGIPPDRIQSIMDPNFGRKPNSVTGKLIYEEYEEAFEKHGRPRGFITTQPDDLATGHKAVKALLKPTVHGDLYLLIDESCKNVDWCFRNYKYKEHQGKDADEKGLSEIVSEVGKDFVDLIRYACVTPIDWWPIEKSHYSEREDYGYNEEAHQEFYDEADGYMVDRPEGSAGV